MKMRLSKILSIILAVTVLLLGFTTVLGQYQVINNSNFEDGLRFWEATIVKRYDYGPRAPYPRIEPIANCKEHFSSSVDGYCVSFDTPDYSDGYIRQIVDIPPGSAYLEINFQKAWRTTLYVTLINLESGHQLEMVPTESPWRSPISEFAGSRVEVRIGVKGDDCGWECYTYLDYIKILVNPKVKTTTSTITTIYTVYKTVTHYVTQTSTSMLSTISTEIFTKTITSRVTSTTTEKIFLETTITQLTTQTIHSTLTKYTTQVITISEVVQKYVGNAFDAVISLGLPLALSSFAGLVVFYSLKKITQDAKGTCHDTYIYYRLTCWHASYRNDS